MSHIQIVHIHAVIVVSVFSMQRKARRRRLMPPEKESCKECWFYIETDSENGLCRRYPPVQMMYHADWCGEFIKRLPIPTETGEES